jgi:tetratricopeptide (TPR) repeat protein
VSRFAFVALALLTACAPGTRSGAGYGGEPGVAPSAYEHYVRGRIAAEDGSHDTALAEFRMAAAAAPDQAELRLAIGNELLDAGRVEPAQAEADAIVAAWPEDAAGWRLLGRVRAARSDPAAAVSAFERAVTLDAADETSYLMLAACYRQLHDDGRALATYRRLVAAVPGSAEGHFRLGRSLLPRDAAAAETALRRAIDLDPSHVDARVALAELYRRQGKADAAEKSLRAAFDRSGADPSVGERLYRLLLEGGDRDGAIKLLRDLDADSRSGAMRLRIAFYLLQLHQGEDALRIARAVAAKEPGERAAQVMIARALAQLGRRAEAIAACLAVPAEADAFTEARALAAELHGREGTPQEGLKLLAEAQARSPDDTGLIIGAASLTEQLGDVARARADLDAALARMPADEGLVYARASLEDRAGDRDAAVAIMRKLLERDGDSVLALNFIGFSYADRDLHLDEAEALLDRAIDLRPDDGYVLDSLGWLLVKRGKLEEARAVLERADRLAPFEPEVMLHLGELYLRRGQPGRARDLFHQALALDPTGRVRTRLEERARKVEAKAP